MSDKPRVIAMIPARGGSVSIPKKNIKPLAGRPLIDWVIKPAIASGIFAEIYVSTDDANRSVFYVVILALMHGGKVKTMPKRIEFECLSHDNPLLFV